ncbi:MAG: hypothetical protein M1832_005914 [Thelocarpon impressellum]|nr:MAG: hypothetical protein M1832_005914 [Thelocarpon impressellum]
MSSEASKIVPLTCHGHSRPVTHLSFSSVVDDDQYYLISACKDNNPMLRDGSTGDWIGTFIGHKGAVWQARISSDASLAATGSADFTAKVWDTHTGETLHTLQHAHIVRAVAFPAQARPAVLATGGAEKKLRIFDLSRSGPAEANGASNGLNGGSVSLAQPAVAPSYEIGPGAHGGTIKSIVWGADVNVLVTAADDGKVRWWDLRARAMLSEFAVEGTVGTCELDAAASSTSSAGVLSVAAGKSVYFFDGLASRRLLKTYSTPGDAVSVALHAESRRFVTGGGSDTWVRVFDWDDGKELEVHKGHHGPIWSTAFAPDGKLYATGSEDGTIKLWKFCAEPYGLWR